MKELSRIKQNRIDYFWLKSRNTADVVLRKNFGEETDEDGTLWYTAETVSFRKPYTREFVELNFDALFDGNGEVKEETTISDLVEALDILTSIVLGED